MTWYEQAAEKLKNEVKSVSGQKESAMKGAVKDALLDFCRQDEEFAQAVVQGGGFSDCMKTVAKNVGASISDLEAYKKAVAFYFPGADIQFHMTVDLCASVKGSAGRPTSVVLNLADFL